MAANNVPEISQHAKVAKIFNTEVTDEINAIVVDYEDNRKALIPTLVRDKLNKRIKTLEAKKAQVILKAKFCDLEQKQAQKYLKANASIGSVISFKDILAIEYG
ncbi:hypothetical protein MMC22_007073 [Lobaria immixta]|nr:hypothetical protein [Lobaria immixta]